MAGKSGDFNKQITNARNSNENFEIEVQDDLKLTGNQRRTSAALLQNAIIQGAGTKKNFTTIQPQGLPPDLIGNEASLVERQNVLIEPRGHKNEGARLPPFKPFKTISDEDNIHLLPGETGERARLNLLDTKTVAKKDVDEVRNAYYKQRELYPELYNKQQVPVEQSAQAQAPVDPQKRKGFLTKLFQKKNKQQPQQPLPRPPVPLPEEPPVVQQEEPVQKQQPPSPPPRKISVAPSPKKSESNKQPPSILKQESVWTTDQVQKKPKYVSSESSSSSSSSEDEGEYQYPWGNMPHYNYGYPSSQYPGFPGGFSPFFNQAYAGGFGPIQTPPCYNPRMDEIMLERCCQRVMKGKVGGSGDKVSKRTCKKSQGLNFDFLPHDDLATEVTMIIEPDEPEPLQYAVENGIMPIICCYMPSSIAVQQPPSPGPPTTMRYPSTYSSRTNSYPHNQDNTENSFAQSNIEDEKDDDNEAQTITENLYQEEIAAATDADEEESLPDIDIIEVQDVGDA